jgi:predicted ribosome-associated RNA-binding protein Tma20
MPSVGCTTRGFSLRKHAHSLAYFLPQIFFVFVLFYALLIPGIVQSQAELINSHLIVIGHENSCSPVATAGNAYACNLLRLPTTPQYEVGACYQFIADVANTGPPTINYSSMGAKPITKITGGITTPLVANDIRAGQIVKVCYDGTQMQCQNCTGNISGGTGLVLSADGTTVVSEKFRVTPVSSTRALVATDGPIVACTAAADVTLTLPAATSPQAHWTVIKVDNGAGACKVQRAGTDTINGGSGTVDAPTQWMRIDVDAVSTTGWSAWLGCLTVDLATQTTGILPAAKLPALVRSRVLTPNQLAVEGSCVLGAAAVLLTGGPKLAAVTCTDTNTDGIDFDVLMPDNWNGGPVSVELAVFYAGTTHTGQVFDMNFSGQCVRGGDPVAAWAITSGATAESVTNVEVQLTASAVANRELKGTTGPLTLSGTCAGGAHVYLHGLVDATGTTFTPMSEAKIVGVKLEYTSQGSE